MFYRNGFAIENERGVAIQEQRRQKERQVITNCTFCGAVFWYEKGKKFMDCTECKRTNYREG